jgi:hypothetical protein
MSEEINGVKIQRLPTIGQPMSIKGSRWKSRITASDKDLRALKDTIKAAGRGRKKVRK